MIIDLPLTSTSTGLEDCPVPMAECGVHAYTPSSIIITDLNTSVPCLLIFSRGLRRKSIVFPSFVQMIIVTGGFDSTGHSILPSMPWGRYRRFGIDCDRTRGMSASKKTIRSVTMATTRRKVDPGLSSTVAMVTILRGNKSQTR